MSFSPSGGSAGLSAAEPENETANRVLLFTARENKSHVSEAFFKTQVKLVLN